MSCYTYGLQQLYSYASVPELYWRNDLTLGQPRVYSPYDQSVVCNDVVGPDGDSGIRLEWQPVASASFYIVQWCKNGSFTGPTLRAVQTSNTFYIMKEETDVNFGDEITFRVMAYNSSGGVSEKSDPRTFRVECGGGGLDSGQAGGSGGGGEDDYCKRYSVKMKVEGPKTTMCCDKVMFHAQYSYACTDDFGNDILTITSIGFGIIKGDANGDIYIESQDGKTCTVVIQSQTSTKFTLVFEIAFITPSGDTFSCQEKMEVTVDCKTGFPQYKPWLSDVYRLNSIAQYVDNSWYDSSGAKMPYGTHDKYVMHPSTHFLAGPVYIISKTAVGTAYNPNSPDCPYQATPESPYMVSLEARVHLPIPWDCEYVRIRPDQECLKCHPYGMYINLANCSGLYCSEFGLGVDEVRERSIYLDAFNSDSVELTMESGCYLRLAWAVDRYVFERNCNSMVFSNLLGTQVNNVKTLALPTTTYAVLSDVAINCYTCEITKSFVYVKSLACV